MALIYAQNEPGGEERSSPAAPSAVIPGLVPGIHVFFTRTTLILRVWLIICCKARVDLPPPCGEGLRVGVLAIAYEGVAPTPPPPTPPHKGEEGLPSQLPFLLDHP